jgi:uncharacterized protein YigE (DUF2233 family)
MKNTRLKTIGIIAIVTIGVFAYWQLTQPIPIDKPIDNDVLDSIRTERKVEMNTYFDTLNYEVRENGNVIKTVSFKGVKYDVFVADLRSVKLQMHWKNKQNELLKDIKSLKTEVEQKGEKLIFATNGGIYSGDYTPEGLYIEKGKTLSKLNLKEANGNFYLKPNGVFVVTNNNSATIVKSQDFPKLEKTLIKGNMTIDFAVQSGPQLLIDGKIHTAFRAGSPNTYIRNGVGIFNNNSKKVVFAISHEAVNLYDFASFFYEVAKCDDALYLDGFVSRMYLDGNATNRKDLDGNFTTMISAVEK